VYLAHPTVHRPRAAARPPHRTSPPRRRSPAPPYVAPAPPLARPTVRRATLAHHGVGPHTSGAAPALTHVTLRVRRTCVRGEMGVRQGPNARLPDVQDDMDTDPDSGVAHVAARRPRSARRAGRATPSSAGRLSGQPDGVRLTGQLFRTRSSCRGFVGTLPGCVGRSSHVSRSARESYDSAHMDAETCPSSVSLAGCESEVARGLLGREPCSAM